MYADRKELYKQLGDARQSKILAYITGDRPGLETQISAEVADFFVSHLDLMDGEKISLYLYTRGGDALASWNIANLIRQFCHHFEVIIPSKCFSGGTLISLAADSIVMTKQATLGPIDPSIVTPLNPTPVGAEPGAKAPVSVEAISGFFELARQESAGCSTSLTNAFMSLAGQVHPLVLGQAHRTRGQIRMLGGRLLRNHLKDDDKIKKIVDFLAGESGSHDYTINRREAANQLGLKVEKPNDELYNLIRKIYDNIAYELEFSIRYDPQIVLGTQNQKHYCFSRALIESCGGGSHSFITEGELTMQQIPIMQNGQPGMQTVIQDRRTFEGWKHAR